MEKPLIPTNLETNINNNKVHKKKEVVISFNLKYTNI